MSREYDELLAAAKAVIIPTSRLRNAITAYEAAVKQPWDGRERRKEDALGFDADSDWRKP